jgi:hypothetical protein
MLRINLAFLSIALLLASTARAQVRGGGGAMRMSMSGMSGGCASGTNGTGASSSLASTATGGGANTPGFGTNLAATNSGIGGSANAATVGAGNNTNAAIAAANSGMGGYGITAWSNPYAQVTNAYGTSTGGFGAMSGMNDGPSAFGWNESYLLSDPLAASLAATERSSTDRTPRTRAKSRTRVKRRVTRAKVASR